MNSIKILLVVVMLAHSAWASPARSIASAEAMTIESEEAEQIAFSNETREEKIQRLLQAKAKIEAGKQELAELRKKVYINGGSYLATGLLVALDLLLQRRARLKAGASFRSHPFDGVFLLTSVFFGAWSVWGTGSVIVDAVDLNRMEKNLAQLEAEVDVQLKEFQ